MASKAKIMKVKANKWLDCIKLKSFCITKEITNKNLKKETMKWNNIFVNCNL